MTDFRDTLMKPEDIATYSYLYGRYSALRDVCNTTQLFDDEAKEHLIALRDMMFDSVMEEYPENTILQLTGALEDEVT